jgi:signal transduction histidine kinase
MNRKISVKLFGVTVLFFGLIILAFAFFQALLFESYYEAKKQKEFKAGFQNMQALYEKDQAPADPQKEPGYLKEFEKGNNAQTAFVSVAEGAIKIRMLMEKGENTAFIQTAKTTDVLVDKPFSLPGPKMVLGRLSNIDLLAYAVNEFVALPAAQKDKNAANPEEPVLFVSVVSENGAKSLVAATFLSEDSEAKNYLFAISSLQPVGEAVSVIRDLYLYFSAFALLLILLLAYIFSNMISKPLVRINRTAMKMAGLDFTVQCDETSRDEIGSLAHTLNFLSANLQRALNELQSANDQLTLDIEKERQLEKMRKEFVAGVSHELKTPISLIMGYAEGLKENLADGTDKERYLHVISDETQKMGTLVSDMLDLSQLESGRFSLKMGEFSLNELLEYIVRKFSTCFSEKHLKVEFVLPEKPIYVYADEFRIEQVVNNFLNNAIRHTPEYGRIGIKAAGTGPAARVEIENEGPCIEESELENIWQKFYKIDKSRNRDESGNGTGLGLAIVRNILLLHDAKHGVENTRTGVRFFFELPKS